jgi:hypothetical protein
MTLAEHERHLRAALFEASLSEQALLVSSLHTPRPDVEGYMSTLRLLDQQCVEYEGLLADYRKDVVNRDKQHRDDATMAVKNLTQKMQLSINDGDFYQLDLDRHTKHQELKLMPVIDSTYFNLLHAAKS